MRQRAEAWHEPERQPVEILLARRIQRKGSHYNSLCGPRGWILSKTPLFPPLRDSIIRPHVILKFSLRISAASFRRGTQGK